MHGEKAERINVLVFVICVCGTNNFAALHDETGLHIQSNHDIDHNVAVKSFNIVSDKDLEIFCTKVA